jgi:hypothetical protein
MMMALTSAASSLGNPTFFSDDSMVGLSYCVSALFQAKAATKPNADVTSVIIAATTTVLAAAACARATACASLSRAAGSASVCHGS